MTDDQKPRIAPPPSVDDVLSSLTDQSRIGQVDFSVALAPDLTSLAAKDDVRANRPDNARARIATTRRTSHVTSASERAALAVIEEPPAEEPVDAEVVAEDLVVGEPVAEEPVVEEPVVQGPVEAPKPTQASAKPKKVRPPKAAKASAPDLEPAPAPEPEPVVATTPPPAPVAAPVPEPVSPPAPKLDVAREVEEIAEGVIIRMRAAEDATLRHLDAMQTEATRRYELVTAQAELDAELIRLQSRREAHAIVAAARMRAGEVDDLHDDPGDTGHRLAVFGDAVSRVADSTESLLATRQRTPERPSGS